MSNPAGQLKQAPSSYSAVLKHVQAFFRLNGVPSDGSEEYAESFMAREVLHTLRVAKEVQVGKLVQLAESIEGFLPDLDIDHGDGVTDFRQAANDLIQYVEDNLIKDENMQHELEVKGEDPEGKHQKHAKGHNCRSCQIQRDNLEMQLFRRRQIINARKLHPKTKSNASNIVTTQPPMYFANQPSMFLPQNPKKRATRRVTESSDIDDIFGSLLKKSKARNPNLAPTVVATSSVQSVRNRRPSLSAYLQTPEQVANLARFARQAKGVRKHQRSILSRYTAGGAF